jgi:hypothetical protein
MSHKMKEQRLRNRQKIMTWYPRAVDLALPAVPVGRDRAEVRKILGRVLAGGKFPVCSGTCWQTAQATALLARDPRVQYVEGVSWNVKRVGEQYAPLFQHDGECSSDVCVCKPLPHAWNTVSGHVVDLQAEFFNWRFGGEYLHEPMKVYSAEDIPAGGVSGSIYQKAWMEEHQDREPESMGAICQRIFKEASDRLVQRNRGKVEPSAETARKVREFLSKLNEPRGYTMKEFANHCESFYRPNCGLNSSATI